MSDKRKTPRAPILTQVEAQGDVATALGHARDISLGGMLIESPETITEGATVIVRFFIPPDRKPIQAAGRVVRAEAGKSMGISFMGLRQSDEERIADYIRGIQEVSAELADVQPPGTSAERRSARIHRRVPLQLSWQDEEGRTRQEAGETQLLSRHGALVLTFTELQPGQLVRIAAPEARNAVARVAWVKPSEMTGRVDVGVEILGKEDFWGIEFSPYRPGYAGDRDRRRSPRVPRKVSLVLVWTDELGRVREEKAETLLLSQYGALLKAPLELPLQQRVTLRLPDEGRQADAEVVWVRSVESSGAVSLAIEFLQDENFWGLLPFPPLEDDAPAAE